MREFAQVATGILLGVPAIAGVIGIVDATTAQEAQKAAAVLAYVVAISACLRAGGFWK